MSIKMIDISEKQKVHREAIAIGSIRLKPKTIELIKNREIEKGDIFPAATVSAILAAKKTPEMIPLCHQIPLTNVEVDFRVNMDMITVTVTVKTNAKTGVEMEALVGVSAALLTIWDMVKKYEKDQHGQYPSTEIAGIKIIKKIKNMLVNIEPT